MPTRAAIQCWIDDTAKATCWSQSHSQLQPQPQPRLQSLRHRTPLTIIDINTSNHSTCTSPVAPRYNGILSIDRKRKHNPECPDSPKSTISSAAQRVKPHKMPRKGAHASSSSSPVRRSRRSPNKTDIPGAGTWLGGIDKEKDDIYIESGGKEGGRYDDEGEDEISREAVTSTPRASRQLHYADHLGEGKTHDEDDREDRNDRNPFTHRPRLQAQSVSSALSSGTSTTSGLESATSKRSRSPVKNGADLFLARIRQTSLADHDLPADAYQLLSDLRDIADGDGVIPAIIKTNAHLAALIPQPELASIRKRHWSGDGDCNVLDEDDSRVTAAHMQLVQLVSIVEKAAECRLEGESEPAWNAKVHDPLFQLALCSHDAPARNGQERTKHARCSSGRVRPWNM